MKTLFELLARLLPTKDVSAIVASFEAFASKLEAADARQTTKAADLTQQSRVLSIKAEYARQEASRASRVASNIRSITA